MKRCSCTSIQRLAVPMYEVSLHLIRTRVDKEAAYLVMVCTFSTPRAMWLRDTSCTEEVAVLTAASSFQSALLPF